MKTKLPFKITTIEEAKAFLRELYNNGEAFHPDDSANHLVGNPFTTEEGTQLNKLMGDILRLEQDNSSEDSPHGFFSPHGYLLMLDRPLSRADALRNLVDVLREQLVADDFLNEHIVEAIDYAELAILNSEK